MAKEKKVSFKHFENKNLASTDLKTIDGIYSYFPQYFRITYNRKTSSFKSLFVENVFNAYRESKQQILLIPMKTKEVDNQWNQILELLIEKDKVVLDLTVQFVIREIGHFEFESFKTYYHECSKNFLYYLDGSIISMISRDIRIRNLPGTSKVFSEYVFDHGKNVKLLAQKYPVYPLSSISPTLAYYQDIIEMLEELNPQLKKKVISSWVETLIKVYKAISSEFRVDISKENYQISYLPIIFFLTDKGRNIIEQILNKILTNQEMDFFKDIVDELFTSPISNLEINE